MVQCKITTCAAAEHVLYGAVEAHTVEEMLAKGQQAQERPLQQHQQCIVWLPGRERIHNTAAGTSGRERGCKTLEELDLCSPRRCTWLADTRFRPWPPAFRLTRNTTGLPAPAHVQVYGCARRASKAIAAWVHALPAGLAWLTDTWKCVSACHTMTASRWDAVRSTGSHRLPCRG